MKLVPIAEAYHSALVSHRPIKSDCKGFINEHEAESGVMVYNIA